MMRSATAFVGVLLLSAAAVLAAAGGRYIPPGTPRPIPPAEAPQHFTMPPGFNATLFAGEPDVVQPIAFTFDDRGRLWVAENLSYPKWQQEGTTGHDRLVIFEDTDGDGHFDKRTVFADNLMNLSGFEVGFGGVWACSAPRLIFIPMNPGEDKPAGPELVVLDGWDRDKIGHNMFNGLAWGPDGWLYGMHGILATSTVGAPGTPAEKRTPINTGVWRYHPTKKLFEVVATGTTNPWGLDWDDYGQPFITNCVIKHLFHVIPGARYQRMHGEDFNPNNYSLMESCADHLHWAGGAWTDSRGSLGKHSDAGGGHAHVGCMVYLGDNWPDEYRNSMFTCNLHGNRINNDTLDREGSGYVARHKPDFMFANDPWFRGITLRYGPDGGVFVSDWNETGECHNHEGIDQTTGRIYKVTYGKTKPFAGDLSKMSDAQLVDLQTSKNDWLVRHARRLLQERATAKKPEPATVAGLVKIATEDKDERHQLRAIWAMHGIGELDESKMLTLLGATGEHVRASTLQLALENRQPSEALLAKVADLAKWDPSPVVRLNIASVMQRIAPEKRWPIADGLVGHAGDAKDQNLPLMIWYAIEPLVPLDADRAIALLEKTKVPLVREYIARRLGENLTPLVKVLERTSDADVQRDILRGMSDGLAGQRSVAMPAGWHAVYEKLDKSANAEVSDKATGLALLFGDPGAVAELTAVVRDPKADVKARQAAMQALVRTRSAGIDTLLRDALADPALSSAAVRGLSERGDDSTPGLILGQYKSLPPDARAVAVQTLCARAPFATALLTAMEKGIVPRADLSAFTARQILDLKDKKVKAQLEKVWGVVRDSSNDKAILAVKYRSFLTADEIKKANLSAGRAVFARTCAQCHTLFDAGAALGPNLTGSQRANLDYILENVLDPSAVVGKDYEMLIVDTKDGRTLTGTLGGETDAALTLHQPAPAGDVTVPKNEIEKRRVSPISIMPEGQFEQMKQEEVRDLVGYLASPVQVALPPESGK